MRTIALDARMYMEFIVEPGWTLLPSDNLYIFIKEHYYY
jgi:hypothetical protein